MICMLCCRSNVFTDTVMSLKQTWQQKSYLWMTVQNPEGQSSYSNVRLLFLTDTVSLWPETQHNRWSSHSTDQRGQQSSSILISLILNSPLKKTDLRVKTTDVPRPPYRYIELFKFKNHQVKRDAKVSRESLTPQWWCECCFGHFPVCCINNICGETSLTS